MTTVNVQGFGPVNFPEGMTPEQISAAIERDILPKMKAKQGPAPDAVPSSPMPPKMDSMELSWAEKNIAPTLEKLVGSNPQGSKIGRLVQGAADAPIGVMQLAANAVGLGDPVNKRVQDLEQSYQGQRKLAGSDGFDGWRMAGNVAGTAPMIPAGGAAPLSLASILRGMGTGAAFGTAQPVTEGDDFWATKGDQAKVGTIAGGLSVPVGAGLARLIKPNTGAAQRTLMDENVTLTPGQILGGGMQRAEDAMTSWPVVGDMIRNAKNRTLGDMNRAAYGRALKPIGVESKNLPAGPEGVLAVKQALGDAYDKLLPKLTFRADGEFSASLKNLQTLAQELPEKEAAEFNNILKKQLGQLSKGGTMDGETFKMVEGSLGKEAKAFGQSLDPYHKKLGDALNEALTVFRDGLKRSNPGYADDLAKINEGYANYTRIRAAAASAGDKSQGFTPGQLAAGVRQMDKSVGKGNVATGKALMQDLSDASRQVLPSTVADSGTPLRHAFQLAPWLAGAAMGANTLAPGVGLAGAAGAAGLGAMATLPYTKSGQKLAQLLLAQRPKGAKEMADLVRQAGPLIGAAGAPSLLD